MKQILKSSSLPRVFFHDPPWPLAGSGPITTYDGLNWPPWPSSSHIVKTHNYATIAGTTKKGARI
jgi:hypothetical protein